MVIRHFLALHMLCRLLIKHSTAESKSEMVWLVLRALKEIPWPVDCRGLPELVTRLECLQAIIIVGHRKVAMDFWREYGPQIESRTNDTALLWEVRSHWLIACLEASEIESDPQEDQKRAFAEAEDLAPRVFQMLEDLGESGTRGGRRRTSFGGTNESVCDNMRQ